jgi:hypothetical protein
MRGAERRGASKLTDHLLSKERCQHLKKKQKQKQHQTKKRKTKVRAISQEVATTQNKCRGSSEDEERVFKGREQRQQAWGQQQHQKPCPLESPSVINVTNIRPITRNTGRELEMKRVKKDGDRWDSKSGSASKRTNVREREELEQ